MAQVLDQVLGSRGCQWSRKGNIIMVTRKESKVQGYRLLKGYVKDEEGEAVIGAFVKVEGVPISRRLLMRMDIIRSRCLPPKAR